VRRRRRREESSPSVFSASEDVASVPADGKVNQVVTIFQQNSRLRCALGQMGLGLVMLALLVVQLRGLVLSGALAMPGGLARGMGGGCRWGRHRGGVCGARGRGRGAQAEKLELRALDEEELPVLLAHPEAGHAILWKAGKVAAGHLPLRPALLTDEGLPPGSGATMG
jgi:hypothetical protein